MNYLMFIYISAVWGSSFVLMKWADDSYDPLSLATYRLIGAAVTLYICRLFVKEKTTFPKKDIGPLFLLSVSTIIPFAVQPFLITKYGSAFIGMMVVFVPLSTIIVSIPLLKRYPAKREVLGVLGGLGFSWLIVNDGMERNVTLIDFLLAFSIPLSYALGNTYTKKRLSHLKSLDLSLGIMVFSAIMLWPFATYFEEIHVNDQFNEATSYLLLLGIFGTGIPIVLFYYLINKKGPLFAGMVTYVIPIGALVWGAATKERITDLQIMAIAGLLLMVALVQWPDKKSTKEPQ